MLTFFTIFISSFVIALSGAMMPGPLLAATVSESSRRGFLAGPLLMVGHGLLEGVLMVGLLVGLGPLLKRDGVFAAVALAGAGLLAWMGVGMLRALPRLRLSFDDPADVRGHLVLRGALMSIANPYWSIWWATIGLSYILHCTRWGAWGIGFFFFGHIAADFAWYSVVAGAVAGGRRFFSDRIYRAIVGVCAGFLLLFACYFAYAGVRRVLALDRGGVVAPSAGAARVQAPASAMGRFLPSGPTLT